MKKSIILIVILLCMVFTGCSSVAEDGSEVVQIRERLFIQQCNNIYLNPAEYMDKTIRLEGLFTIGGFNGEEGYAIYRRTPGCCGDDGQVGFEISYSGEQPQENDWIAVEGTFAIEEKNAKKHLVLHVSKLDIKEERGAEFISE